MGELSQTQRDYLAEIYQIGHIEGDTTTEGFVASSKLAERLFTSQSGVNRMLERLRESDLIQHERYIGVQLTSAGLHAAQSLLRTQGIIESFMVHVMRFGWHEVYLEARMMRQHINERTVNRMWELAGQPLTSPFGEPIAPDATPYTDDIPLCDAAAEQDYLLSRVLTREPDRLQYLAALNLKPGLPLHLLHKAPFSGPLQVQLDREYRILGFQLARMVTVVPVT